ncbi:MAG: flagellar biosynthesis anti-sigma factor FlgM [bacterium]
MIIQNEGLRGLEAYNLNNNINKKLESQENRNIEFVPQKNNDKVELSDDSSDFSKIREVINEVPDDISEERQARVQELKSSIDKGLYNVNGIAVATKMIKQIILD